MSVKCTLRRRLLLFDACSLDLKRINGGEAIVISRRIMSQPFSGDLRPGPHLRTTCRCSVLPGVTLFCVASTLLSFTRVVLSRPSQSPVDMKWFMTPEDAPGADCVNITFFFVLR